jgi:hypothetical protein
MRKILERYGQVLKAVAPSAAQAARRLEAAQRYGFSVHEIYFQRYEQMPIGLPYELAQLLDRCGIDEDQVYEVQFHYSAETQLPFLQVRLIGTTEDELIDVPIHTQEPQ